MSISPIGSTASVQAEPQAPTSKAPVSDAPVAPQPAYTVSLSAAAHKASGGDVNHDGDSQ